jgi:hypothetical protein
MLSDDYKAELNTKLDELEALSNLYYRATQKIGIHTFIEHTGFINEHLKILRRALSEGTDIAMLSNHNELIVDVKPYEAQYLAEKFACMFAPILKEKNCWKLFVEAAESEGCGTGE